MPATTDPPDTYITVTEAMEITGVSRPTIHRWALDEGRLGACYVGKRLKVSRADVQAMIQPVIPRQKSA